MKDVVLLGKGKLACQVAEWLVLSPDYFLSTIVPEYPEPSWAESLDNWARSCGITITEDHNAVPPHYLAISIFYGKIFKQDFIDRHTHVINLHNSPLPLYRGVRPINWALKNGEHHHGITIHEITANIDDGPILGQICYPIYPEFEEVQDVYHKSMEYGILLFNDVMTKFEDITPREQDHTKATYYSMKDAEQLGDRSSWTRDDSKV